MISNATLPFGLLLKRSRRAAGMTQEQLAEKASLSVRGISDLERGLRQPRKDTLEMLLDALQLETVERTELESAALSLTTGRNVALERGGPEGDARSIASPTPGPMVRRRPELNRLLAIADVVARGSSRLVLLTGEPGIGKTRMAQEVALSAASRGAVAAAGRCYETDQDVAYYPFLDVIATIYSAAPDSVREDVPRLWPSLAWLLPEDLLEATPPAKSGSTVLGEEQRFFWAVTGFLRSVAESTPVVILVDDLHWADDASLKLLLYLARHTGNDPILLLGTYRDAELARHHPLARALVDLNRERLVERVAIHRLDETGTAELITGVMDEIELSPAVIDLIHARTEGNPFFIQEVLRALVERGEIYREGGRWKCEEITELLTPPTILAAIGERVARLPSGAQAALYRASVLGQNFDFDALRSLGNSSEEELELALDAALAAGLIREEGIDRYAFTHALTQQALYDELSMRRKRSLHIAAAETLHRVPDRLRRTRSAELARHFREGGDIPRAIMYALLAGDQAGDIAAYGDAERLYRSALELASHDELAESDASLRLSTLQKLGRVLDLTEQYDEALTTLEEVAELCRQRGDITGEAEAVSEIGWILHNRGADLEGIARVQPTVDAMELQAGAIDLRALAALYTALSRLFFGLGRFSDDLRSAERARELAEQRRDLEVLAVADARRGAALMMVGRREEAAHALSDAVTMAGETGNLGTMTVALGNLAQMAIDRGDYVRARVKCEEAVEVAERTGLDGRVAWTLTRLGYVHLLMGDWTKARSLFERCLRALAGDARSAALPRLCLGEVDVLEGAWGSGTKLIEEALEADTRGQDLWLDGLGQRVLAEIDLLRDRPEQAVERLVPFVDEPAPWLPRGSILFTLLFAPLAYAYLKLKEEGRAEALLIAGLEQTRRHDHGMARVDLLRVQASVHARQGRLEEAWTAFHEALNEARQMPDPYRQVRVLAESANLVTTPDQIDGVRAYLQEGLATAQRLGCRPYIRHIGEALSRLADS